MTPEKLQSAVAAAAGGPRDSPPNSGDVDARGRVAWTETDRNSEIASLHVAAGRRMLFERCLSLCDTSDWGYEGSSGSNVVWHGDRVVLVSRERSRSYLWSVDPDRGIEEVKCLGPWAWVIDGDLVVWVADDPGLLSTAALPSLAPRPPLPYRNTPEHPHYGLKSRGGGRLDVSTQEFGKAPRLLETLLLPTKEQRAATTPVDGLFALVERRLFPDSPVPDAARLLIEAAAEPFVRVAQSSLPPVWISVYWHRHLVAAGHTVEAQEMLRVFDGIAAPLPDSEPESGWDPAWSARDGQVELAVRHVRRQARVQAEACRSGRLPHGWYCLLFNPAPRSDVPGSRVNAATLSPAVRRVFQIMAPTRPEDLRDRA